MAERARRRCLPLTMHFAPAMPQLDNRSRGLIDGLLGPVVDHAIRTTLRGGVHIEVEPDADRGALMLSVADSGPGEVSAATHREWLALARKMNASVGVESARGVGTVVRIRLQGE